MQTQIEQPAIADVLTRDAHDRPPHPQIKLSVAVQRMLRCPACRSEVELIDEQFHCAHTACGASYPIVNGIPVLINDESSLFSIDDFVQQRNTYFKDESRAQVLLKRVMPKISKNIKGKQNYDKLVELLLELSDNPRVLVLGGGIVGHGLETLLAQPSIELVESDVAFGPRTTMIGDGHDIPFADESFDGVIIQGVISVLVDPYRCVEEIHRVLKKDGLVYAETAFVQQVVAGRYDFTRFTYLGHRRLFRRFEEIASGAVCGPGMALSWTYQYFLLSFTESRLVRRLIRIFARLTSFYLKYFDHYLIDKAGTLDAASAYYFIGRKSDRTLSDRELIRLYRGMC